MKKSRMLLLLIFLLGSCALLYALLYAGAKREAIRNLNVQQTLLARQAARGIEDFFTTWTRILTILAETSHIAQMDGTGRETVEGFYQANREQIRAITRVDAGGRIVFTFPYDRNFIGRDISSQNHVREIMRTRKPVVSDVFRAVQGYDTVALHVPVFRAGTYRGTLAVTIDFQSLARRYLEAIKIGNTGYAWVTSRSGTELYCPVPGHIGKSVYETSKDFPSILAMAGEMLQRREGTTTYSYNRIIGETVDTVKKHAVYMPISVGNTFWALVVATPEDEALATLTGFRNRLILIILFTLLGAGLFFLLRVAGLAHHPGGQGAPEGGNGAAGKRGEIPFPDRERTGGGIRSCRREVRVPEPDGRRPFGRPHGRRLDRDAYPRQDTPPPSRSGARSPPAAL